MRILFVSMDVPFPVTRGQRMRNWALLRVLAEEGHRVALVSFAEPRDMKSDHGALQQICDRIELVPVVSGGKGRWKGYAGRVKSIWSSLPYGAWRFRSPAIKRKVREVLQQESVDAVIWDEVYNLVNLEHDLPAPVLLNSHDLMHVIWRRFLEVESNPLKRAYARVELKKLLRWEPRACSAVTGVMACSKHDGALYRRMNPDTPVTIVTNSVRIEDYDPRSADDGRTVLFVGGMDWFPNRDAVEFFASSILPELRKLTHEFQFVVAGKAPPAKALRRFARIPDIRFTGTVPDMRVEIAKAAVCVVPLRIGSGVRWKILEAGAMGKPMVSTTMGMEGLEFANGEEILLANDPVNFAQAVASLLRDPSRRCEVGRAARRRVEQQYSFKALRIAVREALASLDAGRLRPAHQASTSASDREVTR